jgi:nucleoside-diphosphate-sugar epimerase
MTNWSKYHGSYFSGKTFLVTGGAGFIGSHLTEALIALDAQVRVLDDLSGGDTDNLTPSAAVDDGRITFIKGSILNQDVVSKAVEGCDAVFHQAALGSVPRSVELPRLYCEVNIMGTLNVLEAARAAKVRRVMFAASSSAYGDSPTLPKIETMPVLPKSPYAASKVADEALMRAYADSYGLDTACLRYFNIFGPRQNANSAYAAVIAGFAKAILSGQNPTIYGDGEQSRDFTFVHNAVHANLLAARSENNIRGRVLNVAVGQRITVNELAAQMLDVYERNDLKPTHVSERAGDVKHSLADLTATKETLGYEPVVSFSDGLKATLAWYKTIMQPA